MDATARLRQQIEQERNRTRARHIDHVRERVCEALNRTPTLHPAVYLFGSWATGQFDGVSDTDLLVVAPTAAQADEAQRRLMDVADDVVAFSRFEWERRLVEGDSFVRRVADERVLLVGEEAGRYV